MGWKKSLIISFPLYIIGLIILVIMIEEKEKYFLAGMGLSLIFFFLIFVPLLKKLRKDGDVKPKIKCPNCGYEGVAKNRLKAWVALLLFFFTGIFLWIPFSVYVLGAPKWICPRCEFRKVVKLPWKTPP